MSLRDAFRQWLEHEVHGRDSEAELLARITARRRSRPWRWGLVAAAAAGLAFAASQRWHPVSPEPDETLIYVRESGAPEERALVIRLSEAP